MDALFNLTILLSLRIPAHSPKLSEVLLVHYQFVFAFLWCCKAITKAENRSNHI